MTTQTNNLTKAERDIIALAEKGGNDASLMLMERIDEVDTKVDTVQSKVSDLEAQLAQDPPVSDETKIERVAMKLAAKLASLEKGDDGKDGADGHTPTEAEIRAIIEPLIPQPTNGKDARNPLTVSPQPPANPQIGDLWYQN